MGRRGDSEHLLDVEAGCFESGFGGGDGRDAGAVLEMRGFRERCPVASPFDAHGFCEGSQLGIDAVGERRDFFVEVDSVLKQAEVDGQPVVVPAGTGAGFGDDVPWACASLGVERGLLGVGAEAAEDFAGDAVLRKDRSGGGEECFKLGAGFPVQATEVFKCAFAVHHLALSGMIPRHGAKTETVAFPPAYVSRYGTSPMEPL